MKYTHVIAAMTGLLFLAACATPEQRAAQAATQRSTDNAECLTLGFNPGTEKFADCLLRLKEIRAQEEKTKALRNVRRDPFWPWVRPHQRYRYPYWH